MAALQSWLAAKHAVRLRNGAMWSAIATACRTQLFVLLPDSPDMNPIETAFAQDAARQAPERTVDGLSDPLAS